MFEFEKPRQRKLTSREEITRDCIKDVRRNLIMVQLELEFLRGFLKNADDLIDKSQHDIVKENRLSQMANQKNLLELDEHILLSKLEFLKSERQKQNDKRKKQELKDKAEIKSIKEFPEKISISDLSEIKENK